MSLDVTLEMRSAKPAVCEHCGHPAVDLAGITVEEVYSANITHNLTKMADAAGIYEYLWRPEEVAVTQAKQLIQPLRDGLAKLKADPEYYETFNAKNGWGLYEHFVPFVAKYLQACENYPEAYVSACR